MVAGDASNESATEQITLLVNHPNPPDNKIAITLLLQRHIATKIVIPMKDKLAVAAINGRMESG
jgi:hypothetical protein